MQEHLLTEYRASLTRYIASHGHLLDKYGISSVTCEAGQTLLQQATPLHSVYIIHSGLVKVVRATSLGQAFTLGVFERGEVLGDVEAIMNMPHFSTVEAVIKCTLWKIAPEQFLKMLSQEPDFNLLIHKAMISKLLNTSHKAAIQSTNKLFYSLLIVLREFSRLNELQISKTLLSEALGTSVRNLNRLLTQLEEEQLITIKQSIISNIDLQLLQHKIHAYENTIQ
jgi:CRP-like cAMP-binding protein